MSTTAAALEPTGRTERAETNPVKNCRDKRDKRDTLSCKTSSNSATPGQSRDNRDKAQPPCFKLTDKGLYWCDVIRNKDGEVTGPTAPERICSHIKVIAKTRDTASKSWGRLVTFRDPDGVEHRLTVPNNIHSSNGDELRAILLDEGLAITTETRNRRRIGDYIQQSKPDVSARCVDRTGWHGDVFVLPQDVYGDSEVEPFLFQGMNTDGLQLGQSGTLEGWITNVSAPCKGNTRLILSICAGFAGPCLGLINAEGGGIHLRGKSSIGKTTALDVASSMYGLPRNFTRTWRSTDNAPEGAASMHTDLLMVLDEIGQLDPKHAGQVAYMIANGEGKGRSHRDGSPRKAATWRVLFLSSGEVSLADLVTQSGGKVRAGQEVRVIDLPAETTFGLFDIIPDGLSPAAFADQLRTESSKHFGHAIPAFLNIMTGDPGPLREALRQLRDGILETIKPVGTSGQVGRVASRFALIAAAGELATAYRLTGWFTGDAESAAKTCFNDWLESRGTVGNSENMAMLKQVRGFLEAHGEARFTRWEASEEGARTINRAGYRKHGEHGPTYFIEREVFRNEISSGFDHKAVADVLLAHGALIREKGGDRTQSVRLPDGRKTRVYVVAPELWSTS